MLSKADIRFIQNLDKKKYRLQSNSFLAEGLKAITDLSSHFHCRMLITKESCRTSFTEAFLQKIDRIEYLPENADFSRFSHCQTPRPYIAIFALEHSLSLEMPRAATLALFLDQVQDPGNLGTIIRTADWFGIKQIYLSDACADPFQPKVVQASMGALAHISLYSLVDKELFLDNFLANSGVLIGGTLPGDNIYTMHIDSRKTRLLAIGNEGTGLSMEVLRRLTHRAFIPCFSSSKEHAESLNAAIAAAILMSELQRPK